MRATARPWRHCKEGAKSALNNNNNDNNKHKNDHDKHKMIMIIIMIITMAKTYKGEL